MPEFAEFNDIMDKQAEVERLAQANKDFQPSLDKLRDSLEKLPKTEFKPNSPGVSDGKIIYMDSNTGKTVKFGEFNNITDYMDSQKTKLDESKNSTDKDNIIKETSIEYAKGVLGVDNVKVADAVRRNVEIQLDWEIQKGEIQGNSKAENIAEKILGKDTINSLNDPTNNVVGSDGKAPKEAQEAGSKLRDSIAKDLNVSSEKAQSLIDQITEDYKKGNTENIEKYEKKVKEMMDSANSPRERDTIEKMWDAFKILGLGLAGYFTWSFIHQHQLDLTGCFVTVYDSTGNGTGQSGKVKQLTCGDYKKNGYGNYDITLTQENCIKNGETYPKVDGCSGNCNTDINGDTCTTCPQKSDAGDSICSGYCNDSYIKSKDPSLIYKFSCSNWTFAGALGDIGNQAGKLFTGLLTSLVTFIDKLLKWGPYILVGILGAYVIYLLIRYFFGGDGGNSDKIVIKEESPPSEPTGHSFGYFMNSRNNNRNKKYVIKF